MPWFGGTRQSLKMGSGRSGVYWVADDRGGRKPKSRKRRGSTGRLGDGGSGAGSPPLPPPAGILKRSGRGLRGSQPSFQFEEGMVPEEMAAAVPMPSEQSVNAMFSEMVDELGLSRELMFKLPLEKRWQLYLSKQKEQQSTRGADPQPEFYIDKISTLVEAMKEVRSCEVADTEENLKVASDLKTALRTQPVNFVLRFISQSGLENLLEFLVQMNNIVRNSLLHYAVVGCVKALMNSPDGRAHVLVHPTAITIIAQSLKTTLARTKILVLEIVGALCLVPGGHKKVLTAMDHFQRFAMERIRFQTLIADLTRSLDEPQDSANLQIAVLSFFNAIINYKAGQESLEFRMHLRHELLMLGILPVTDRLSSLNISQLNRHLEIFDLVRIEDERELAARLETIQVDSRSLKSMIDLLHRKTVHTMAHTNLLSIIYHCLLLPIDDPLYVKYWHLIDRLVQQVVLQQRKGVDPDSTPVPINVDNLIQQLLREDEVKAIQWEAEEVKKEREKVTFQLRKKEWECDSLRMERDQYKTAMGRLRQRLNRKTSEATEALAREQDLQERLQLEVTKMEEYRQRSEQLESRLREGNISMADLPSLPPPVTVPGPPPPPPPPPPTHHQPPLPPPLPPAAAQQHFTPPTTTEQLVPAAPTGSEGGLVERRRNAPKPSQALKSFNWSKIPPVQIERTIWSKVDESTVHNVMDLKQFEEKFSAYQRKETAETSGLMAGGTLRRRSVLDRPKEMSVIESKRAQNCSIVLSTLKMSNDEVRRVVMTMDKEEELEKDMVEQLLKYVPTVAERDLLNSHAHEMESFARPDRFLLEMSRIPRYSQRLKSLFFKKTLSDRLDDVRPKIESIHFSCRELKTSLKLRKVLEVVLAFGNFMNRGNRGNACGFRLSSLNKMADTKSSSDPDLNLLHYLVQTLETKFPDALTLETDLPHIRKASKVDFKEVEKEFSDMKIDLRDLEHELEFQRRSGAADPSDIFVPVMTDFAADVRSVFASIQTQLLETRTEFHNTLLFFGEDPSEITTEEFFGIFTIFLHSFNEAHVELIAVQKKKEEEEKRKEELERYKQLTIQRRKKRQEAQSTDTRDTSVMGDAADFEEKAELDDLIAVLKSGEYFSRQRGRRLSMMSTTSSSGATNPRNSRVLEFSRERSSSSLVGGGAEDNSSPNQDS